MDSGSFRSWQTPSISINRNDLCRLRIGTLLCLTVNHYQSLQARLDEDAGAIGCAGQIVSNYQYLCQINSLFIPTPS
jgi:hypothetical protein